MLYYLWRKFCEQNLFQSFTEPKWECSASYLVSRLWILNWCKDSLPCLCINCVLINFLNENKMLECSMLHINQNLISAWPKIFCHFVTHVLKQEIFHFSFLCLIPFDIIYLQFLIQICTAVLILLLFNTWDDGNSPWSKWVEVQLLVLFCGSTGMFIIKMFSCRVLKIYVYIWVGFKVIKVKLQLNERCFAYYRAQQTNLIATLSMTSINQCWREWISIIILINIFFYSLFHFSMDTKYTFYAYYVGDSKYAHPKPCWMHTECLALSHFWAGL